MKYKYSLQEWLDYIENLHPKSIDLGLIRVRNVAIKLGLCHPARIVILVGGTNGKGTTCCLLESIFLNYGVTVGVYSSPHLISYTERLRVNGKELTESLHIKAMAIIDEVRSFQRLTFFEFITLSNLYLLKQQALDVVILEVGLGGRLDATNVVDSDISIVTNVAIDHVDFLGTNYLDIAREKFGIFRTGKPAIVGDFKYVDIVRDLICNWYGGGIYSFIKNDDWWFRVEANQWCWWDRRYKLDLLPLPKVPIENAAVALSVIRFLPFKISKNSIDFALKTAILPGRFQVVSRRPLIILDVAHNPHAASYLSKKLNMMNILGTFRLVVGMLSSKDIFNTLHQLEDLVPIWYFVSLDCMLGASASDLSCCVTSNAIFQKFSDVCSAFNQAVLESDVEDCIVVFGSFHTVSPILKLINKNNQ